MNPHQPFDDMAVIERDDEGDRMRVRECLAGDPRAFEALVEKYQGVVYNVALRMMRDPAEAEEVAQMAFYKAFEHLGAFREGYRFYSWLYRIVVNASLDQIAQRKRRETIEESRPDAEPGIDEVVESRDRCDRLLDALEALRPDHRAIVVLKHLEGMSYEEIGKILEVPVKLVKSRLFSARQALREILKKKGIHAHD
jgi:RNA polymerase sigma-70 factor (ECF subfamily)